MDNPIQQLKESQAKHIAELGAEFLGLTQQQRIIISGKLGETMQAILAIQFNKPEDDTLLLRQHAFMHGSLQAYNELLRFDDAREAEMKERLPSDLPPLDPPSF